MLRRFRLLSLLAAGTPLVCWVLWAWSQSGGYFPNPEHCTTGTTVVRIGENWDCVLLPQLPAGMIMLSLQATCPAGFVEVASLDGRVPQGTVAAHGNVGTVPTRELTLGLVGTGTQTQRVLFCQTP